MKNSNRTYVAIGRLLSPLALIGLRIVTAITKRPRVRVIVRNEYSEVLLVRGVISHRGWWMLPGGGVNRHEEFVAAARRELFEETGIEKQLEDFQYLRTIHRSEYDFHFDAPIYKVLVKKADLPRDLHNPHEIAEIGWFSADALPDDMASLARIAIEEIDK